MNELKKKAAKAALEYIEDNTIIGIGTGSTVNLFIQELQTIKHRIDACVSSSKATEALLRAAGIPVVELNVANEVAVYIDGADEVNHRKEMIKGGGGALTREKIVANAAQKFICIVDHSKLVDRLGGFPIAVEVIPMARSLVARQLLKLGGDPAYREGFLTDNENIILDVFNLSLDDPRVLEDTINVLPGVVENGIFAKRVADIVLVAQENGIQQL
jgi:ribose 5-phosphate isomerase A